MRARTWYLDRGFYPMEVGPRYMYIQTDGGHADRGSDGDWIGGRIRGDVRLVRIRHVPTVAIRSGSSLHTQSSAVRGQVDT